MDTSKLLAPTHKLFEALEVFQVTTNLQPSKGHFASHVKLTDFAFNKTHLVDRLKQSIVNWVFSKAEVRRIFDEEFGEDENYGAASAALYQAARETFRPSAPQGQFGELMLSAFLQHLFQAAPLLRKQKIRTSDKHERFGADAVHYSNQNGEHLYLGESKCYKSKYKFAEAFSVSLDSMNTTLANFHAEIKKFAVGNFIEDDIKPVAVKLLKNQITGILIHPTSIIIYNETTKLHGTSPEDMKKEIQAAIVSQCKKISVDTYKSIPAPALARMTYIIMPVWDLDELLDEFVNSL
jgi:Cap4 SAVED domain